MDKIIKYENIRMFCYSNDHLIKGKIKGIVLDFVGLGGMTMYSNDFGDAIEYANENIIYCIPYYNPWCWMNKNTIEFVNEIVDCLIKKYNIKNVKIVSTGKSMGGLCSLVYARYAKYTPVKVVSNCPVCDLVYHYTERPDLPRTLYSAFFSEEGSIEDVLSRYSPLHLVNRMPDIEYRIFHCLDDKAVNINMHSRKFVSHMLDNKKDVKLIEIPNRGHCDLSIDGLKKYREEVLKTFNL